MQMVNRAGIGRSIWHQVAVAGEKCNVGAIPDQQDAGNKTVC
jgi:hypothetical protein